LQEKERLMRENEQQHHSTTGRISESKPIVSHPPLMMMMNPVPNLSSPVTRPTTTLLQDLTGSNGIPNPFLAVASTALRTPAMLTPSRPTLSNVALTNSTVQDLTKSLMTTNIHRISSATSIPKTSSNALSVPSTIRSSTGLGAPSTVANRNKSAAAELDDFFH
jgi:hypothetical protein